MGYPPSINTTFFQGLPHWGSNSTGILVQEENETAMLITSSSSSNNLTAVAMDDYDLSKHPYPPHLLKTIPTWEFVVKIFMYTVVITIALLGNILVILIVWRNKRMRTTTNYYIVNLAVSDLLVTCSCTWVHLVENLTDGWVLGPFFCKVNSFSQVLSLVSSIMTLTLIACDRFFGIVFAMKAHVTERRSKLFIVLVWLFAVAVSSPLLYYRQQFSRQWLDHKEIWCADTWPLVLKSDPVNPELAIPTYPGRRAYFTFISVVLYFLPVIIMSVAYVFIMVKLWGSRSPGEQIESGVIAKNRMKKRVVLMLMLILMVFTLCWLPLQIYILYAEYRSNQFLPFPAWYEKFRFFAHFIAYANSAFNPIIYTGFNENFKRGFKTLFPVRRRRKEHRYSSIANNTTHSQFDRGDSISLSNTIVTKLS